MKAGIFLICMKKSSVCFIDGAWQGMRDSNPRKRSQSPVCYRYTNPLYQCALSKRIYYYTQNPPFVKHFFCSKHFFYRQGPRHSGGLGARGQERNEAGSTEMPSQ